MPSLLPCWNLQKSLWEMVMQFLCSRFVTLWVWPWVEGTYLRYLNAFWLPPFFPLPGTFISWTSAYLHCRKKYFKAFHETLQVAHRPCIFKYFDRASLKCFWCGLFLPNGVPLLLPFCFHHLAFNCCQRCPEWKLITIQVPILSLCLSLSSKKRNLYVCFSWHMECFKTNVRCPSIWTGCWT